MLTSIPSPSVSQIAIGPLTIHVYALCLMAGMALAWWLGRRRWVARGGLADTFDSVAFVAVVTGIVGARVYHVATHWGDYVGDPLSALYIWEGGIAIFGALIGGALGVLWTTRRHGARLSAFADVLAPGLLAAQAVGRLGNWFNQELFGGPDDGPLAVEIAPEHRPPAYADVETFQPTFLYELTWNALGALLLLWLDRRLGLRRGRLFALYMVVYGTGRFWVEGIRTDPSYMVGPLRTNQVTALVFGLVGAALLVALRRAVPEPWVERAGAGGPDHAAGRDEAAVDDATDGRQEPGENPEYGTTADGTTGESTTADGATADDLTEDGATEGRAAGRRTADG